MIRLLALAGLALVLIGCAWNGPRHKPMPVAERTACLAKGGRVEGVGMFGTPACVIPYADAGKLCSNKSDCQGICMRDEVGGPVPKPGDPMTGTCEATNQTFGCFTIIDKGKVVSSLCQD